MTTGEKETMTSAVERPKSGSLGVTPAGSRPGANLSDDGSPGAAGRGVTYVEDAGVGGDPQPAQEKAVVRPVNDPAGGSGEQAAGPVYAEPTTAGEMPTI